MDTPTLPAPPKIALKNGRGPLDGFMRRAKRPPVSSASFAVIDLTEDSNSSDVTNTQPCAPVKASHCSTDKAVNINTENENQSVAQSREPELATVSLVSEENIDVDEAEDSAALSQLDSTIESEIETENDQKADESHCNESLQSPVSSSSNSSSPEPSKSATTTPVSTQLLHLFV